MKNQYYSQNVKTTEIDLPNGERDTVIQWIYDIHIVEWYVTYLLKQSIDEDDVQDKIQEIYLMICEIPEDKWKGLFEQGKYAISAYVTGIIHQQLISKNSKIYKDYVKYHATEKVKSDLFWEIYDEEH